MRLLGPLKYSISNSIIIIIKCIFYISRLATASFFRFHALLIEC